ncbi:MAG: hypothetical protein K0S14_2338, partial [Thermomicrobiales bacterium]|nr:hypothetical protein [Thermomicrobiales bacterium]
AVKKAKAPWSVDNPRCAHRLTGLAENTPRPFRKEMAALEEFRKD